MLLEVHILKDFGPNLMNRDGQGAPKTALLGGIPRVRVSSQCLKYNIRNSEYFKVGNLEEFKSTRTRAMPGEVLSRLADMNLDEDTKLEVLKSCQKLISAKKKKNEKDSGDEAEAEIAENSELEESGKASSRKEKKSKIKETDLKTNQIVIYSKTDFDAIADLYRKTISESGNPKEAVRNISQADFNACISTKCPIDVALFGKFGCTEAAVSFAHALGTDRFIVGNDYFIAADDLIDEGAAILQDTSFASGCYYEYLSVDLNLLYENLAGYAPRNSVLVDAVLALLKGAFFVTPSGKAKSFANYTGPEAVYIQIKDNAQAISLENAFSVPAKAEQGKSVSDVSIEKFIDRINRNDEKYGIPTMHEFWLNVNANRQKPDKAESFDSIPSLLDTVKAVIEETYPAESAE